jgi:hypothetical protein
MVLVPQPHAFVSIRHRRGVGIGGADPEISRPSIGTTRRRTVRATGSTDPVLAIVRLHVEGWNATSIAAYLETSRQTVHTTLKRWAEEEFAGMPDKSRAPLRPATKVTLRAMATVKELQENPLLGEFRIHAHSDADGLPITVFTFQPKNLPLYRRHGYVVICGEAAPVGLPPWWGLRRNPGAGES